MGKKKEEKKKKICLCPQGGSNSRPWDFLKVKAFKSYFARMRPT